MLRVEYKYQGEEVRIISVTVVLSMVIDIRLESVMLIAKWRVLEKNVQTRMCAIIFLLFSVDGTGTIFFKK